MRLRKITSLTALLSFIALLLTSVILYITPQGRVAYWADWRLWGLTKTQWTNIHINTGLLFTIAIVLHVFYNWRPIRAYLKDKSKNLKIFTKDFNIALIITVLFVLGTYYQIPPLSSVIRLGEKITMGANARYGEPPYGHAELSSLKTFAKKTGLDLKECIERIKGKGLRFENENQRIMDIAKANGLTPQQLYLLLRGGSKTSPAPSDALPEKPQAGFGKLTLADFCQTHGLKIPSVLHALSEKNIKASPEMTMKTIAQKNHTDPIEIYKILKESAKK